MLDHAGAGGRGGAAARSRLRVRVRIERSPAGTPDPERAEVKEQRNPQPAVPILASLDRPSINRHLSKPINHETLLFELAEVRAEWPVVAGKPHAQAVAAAFVGVFPLGEVRAVESEGGFWIEAFEPPARI